MQILRDIDANAEGTWLCLQESIPSRLTITQTVRASRAFIRDLGFSGKLDGESFVKSADVAHAFQFVNKNLLIKRGRQSDNERTNERNNFNHTAIDTRGKDGRRT